MVKDFSSNVSKSTSIEIIILSIFGSGIVLIYIFVWLPYLRSLNSKVWRTKGMLNMIPLDVITKHPTLKNAFI